MREPPLVEVLLRQRQAWLAGAGPRVEDLLRDSPHLAGDRDAVLDLIYQERVLREERGAAPALADYLARFPHLADELRAQFEVDQALAGEDLARPGPLGGSTTPTGPPEAASLPGLPRLRGCDLLGELGRGAMGVVYRGWQRAAKRPVAVKLLPADLPVARARTEIEAAARLQHPHIVQVFEVDSHQGRTALVLEYVEGGTLAQKLAGKPQPPRDAARLVETLARAMAYAHGRGVVHRDLKPGNVLLSAGPDAPLAQCAPKIGDFGLAKLIETDGEARAAMTRSGDILGTPSYMAPEQAGGGTTVVGPAADVYALGAILYECLTGRPPFLGASVLDTLDQVRRDDPVPPSQLQRSTPRDLEVVCLKCLHKTPGRRYGSADELAEDLRRFQAGEPVRARPAWPAERAWKWARRRPAAAALVLVSLLAGAVLLAGGLAFNQALRRQRDVAVRQAGQLDAQLRRTRELLYTTQLLRAGPLCDGDPTQALRLLEDPQACPPDLRCFTWGVLYARCKRYRVSLPAGGPPATVAFSPAAGLLALAGGGDIRLLDARTGAEVGRLAEHAARVRCLAFSRDGRLLASGGSGGKVYLHDLATHQLRGILSPPAGGDVAGLAFHPGGRTLAVNSGPPSGPGAATLWDVRSLRPRRTFRGPTSTLCGVALSPDGHTLACADRENVVRLWDTRTGRQARGLRGHTAPVSCLAFDPEGKRLVSGALDGVVRVWAPGEGGEMDAREALETPIRPVAALAFHRGGQTLAVAGGAPAEDGEPAADVQLWDLLARRGALPLRGHPTGAAAVAFSPDGATLATAGLDGELKLWDHPGRAAGVLLRGHAGAPGSVALSRDGKTLAWVSRDRPGAPGLLVRVHDLDRRTSRVLRGHGRPVRCVALSPDGGSLASAAGAADEPPELLVWETGSGRLLQALTGHAGAVTALAFSPDGKTLASAGRDGAVKLWDVQAGKLRLARAASALPVRVVAFSGDGRRVAAAGGRDGRPGGIDVWDAGSGSLMRTLPAGDAVGCLALSADGSLAAHAERGGVVHLAEVETGAARPGLAVGMKAVASVAFSPDGQALAVAGDGPGVKLWDVPTGQERAALPGGRGGACFVGFAADGGLLVVVGVGEAARLWHAARP
jgi:WD40 repeat protein